MSMTRSFTTSRIEKFERLLRAEEAEAESRLAEHREGISEVRAARSDASADDEHDPEGPTMTQEWSQRSAVLADAEHELADVRRALARLAEGSYGVCERCGKAITVARLEARPTATLCIDCARLIVH
ncbi:TraR/DksA family transcriptional regulator [Agromyces larvae]|uniref:TraR/DksA C4-type zinc finger protein n=1 Tax=Agromyces larvae TaxID=2929802 RepID=A0ABY4BYP4_9MICO|nr:TraR/DksA C4-type zinc finger protein [Agromyces larvae]UOE44283.1 TraR/DksA C4-type zinc finger protein [Agromyces larvae]